MRIARGGLGGEKFPCSFSNYDYWAACDKAQSKHLFRRLCREMAGGLPRRRCIFSPPAIGPPIFDYLGEG